MVLSKPLAAVVAVLLAAAAAVIQYLPDISNDVSNVLTLVIIVAGAWGVAPSAGAWFATHIPHTALVILAGALMSLQALQQDSLHVGKTVHAVIAVVIVVLVTMGVSPAGAGASSSWRGDLSDHRA